jgi:hypothetical protein
MRLQTIINQFAITTRKTREGNTIVEAPIGTEYRRFLFNLQDYVVTGCAGDMVWLSPRQGFYGGVPYGN